MVIYNNRDVVYVLCDVGNVHVILKDSIFEASSPTRHTAELGMLIKKLYPSAAALIVFTDGGPDHNNKHMSVRLGLLALFLELDIDTMLVMRTAPTQSWANPVERVMSVLNLGLQGVALAREEMDEQYEKEFKKCNGMNVVNNVSKDCAQMAPTETENAIEQDDIAEEDAALVGEGEDGEPQRRLEDEVPCDVDDEIREVVREVVALDNNDAEKSKEPNADDDMVVRLSPLDPEDVDDWLRSDADDEVVREEVAGENVVEKGNNEPLTTDDPFVGGASLSDQEEDDWLGSDADDEDMRKQATAENEEVMRHSATTDLRNDANNPFIDAFFTSIQNARDTIAGQWRECTWDKKALDIQCPATSAEVIGLSTYTFVYTFRLPLLSIVCIHFL